MGVSACVDWVWVFGGAFVVGYGWVWGVCMCRQICGWIYHHNVFGKISMK